MRALITGVSGFVGTFLCEKLIDNGYEVVGLSRTPAQNQNIEYISCDISDPEKVYNALKNVKPDEIYHLAGSGFIPLSYSRTEETYNTIVNGTLNLYEALRKLDMDTKVLFVGSAGVYGDGKGTPFTESDLLHPNNPYAGAKACADLISEQYARSFNMRIIRARPFNHTGPRQSSDFVCSSFAKQISNIENERSEHIHVGNLDVMRDFLDVRDVINAYVLLMKKGKFGEAYNVSSNEAISISDLLNMLLESSNIENPLIKVDSNKVRETDAYIRIGDNSKLRLDTGWSPEYKLKNTMIDLLNYWRDASLNA
ncbi:GDP-mannose 4,6-dehydratase [Paenibacillus sp. FJAT-27812]|uniref:GDP-mannose 4,6-dehydratase n=1 Tax=Paenibacillus sp. FJAT-27812 TaxID=1684143 RepID=UPI0006A76C48|nr:GDP-mannose 4,6-dehydratase [Paenibacillus sp. FJAT-27812]